MQGLVSEYRKMRVVELDRLCDGFLRYQQLSINLGSQLALKLTVLVRGTTKNTARRSKRKTSPS